MQKKKYNLKKLSPSRYYHHDNKPFHNILFTWKAMGKVVVVLKPATFQRLNYPLGQSFRQTFFFLQHACSIIVIYNTDSLWSKATHLIFNNIVNCGIVFYVLYIPKVQAFLFIHTRCGYTREHFIWSIWLCLIYLHNIIWNTILAKIKLVYFVQNANRTKT